MIIDSHLHVWDRNRARYAWLDGQPSQIDREVVFEEIEPTLAAHGIDGVVLVQAADNAEDTAHMLATAHLHQRVLGVVGWAPLEDPAAAAERIAALRDDPRIVGVRNLIHDRSDPDWVLRPDFNAGLALLADCGLPFDYVTSQPAALRHLTRISELHPELTIVIDHLGKPPMGGDATAFEAWTALVSQASVNPRIVAKISGLYPSVGSGVGWTDAHLARVVDVALEAFGPQRLMYGGDWPMCLLAGGYSRVWASVQAALERVIGPSERAMIFGGTAQQIYRLRPPPESSV